MLEVNLPQLGSLVLRGQVRQECPQSILSFGFRVQRGVNVGRNGEHAAEIEDFGRKHSA